MHSHSHLISIWFFIGILLLSYGMIIFAASLYYAAHPPDNPVVLSNLHIGIWWGALLIAIGCIYSWKFRPGRR